MPLAERLRRPVERRLVGELEPDAAAGHEPLELGRRALGDDPAAVEQRDPAREPVGLLEVLRRQEDRDAVGDEVADDVPHHPPAPGVEAGRGLVEEDDPRVADERHREVQAPAHAARVGHRGLRGVGDEVEPLEQLGDLAAARLLAQVVEVGHQAQVLLARELAVDRRDLAGEADRGPGPRRARGRRRTRRPGPRPRRREISVERMWIAVVLPAPFGPSSANTVPSGDVEVDAVEDDLLAERLAEAADLDRRAAVRAVVCCAVIAHLPGSAPGGAGQMSSSSTVGWRAARATMSNSSGGTLSRSSSRVSTTSRVDSFGRAP